MKYASNEVVLASYVTEQTFGAQHGGLKAKDVGIRNRVVISIMCSPSRCRTETLQQHDCIPSSAVISHHHLTAVESVIKSIHSSLKSLVRPKMSLLYNRKFHHIHRERMSLAFIQNSRVCRRQDVMRSSITVFVFGLNGVSSP